MIAVIVGVVAFVVGVIFSNALRAKAKDEASKL